MKTNGVWLRFNYEYLMWVERLGSEAVTPEVHDQLEAWLRTWIRDDGPTNMTKKPGYRRSWLSRAIELIGEDRAYMVLAEELVR